MKKNLVKAASTALSLVLAMSLFAGCGTQKKTADPVGQKAATAAPVKMETVTVWTNNASQKAEDEKMVSDFNSGPGKDKGINIDYKIYGADYSNVLKLALAANEGPYLYKNLDLSYVNAGWAVPVEDLPGAKEWLKAYDGMLSNNMHVFKGKVYTVPYVISTCAVAYNKDLLKKNGFNNPPKTWAEFKDMARTITKNGNGKEFGYIEGLKSTGYSGWNGLFQYVPAVGHNGFNQITGKFEYSAFAPFYQMLADLRKEGCWFPGVEGLNNDQARAQFAEGNIGFKFSGSWDVGVWKEQFPAKMEWGWCRPGESASGDPYKYYANSAGALTVGPNSKQLPEKTFEVFKLWNSESAQIALYEGGKQIPLKTDYVKKAKPTTIKNWADIADTSGAFLYSNGPAADVTVEGDSKEIALAKILTLTSPVKETLADLDKRYNAAFEKAKANGLDTQSYIEKSLNNKAK